MNEKVVTPEMIKKAGELLKTEHAERLRLEKVAADNEREKTAQKIAYREVELWITEPFKSHQEFQEKVASLMTEDLEVVEKALERGYTGSRNAGELVGDGGPAPKKGYDNPLAQWIITGELDNK
jgi:hypothetical protein